MRRRVKTHLKAVNPVYTIFPGRLDANTVGISPQSARFCKK